MKLHEQVLKKIGEGAQEVRAAKRKILLTQLFNDLTRKVASAEPSLLGSPYLPNIIYLLFYAFRCLFLSGSLNGDFPMVSCCPIGILPNDRIRYFEILAELYYDDGARMKELEKMDLLLWDNFQFQVLRSLVSFKAVRCPEIIPLLLILFIFIGIGEKLCLNQASHFLFTLTFFQ